MLKLLEDEQ